MKAEEIVAVLDHEVGHYKRKYIYFNLEFSLFYITYRLYIPYFISFINDSVFSEALSVESLSFHIGFIAFGILYSPISEITGLFMNYISRQIEYQADNFAKETFASKPSNYFT